MKLEVTSTNYCATIVVLDDPYTLAGCDNVRGVKVFGNQVIVGKDQRAGDVGVFFPAESALSADFLKNNNLYRKTDLNLDKDAKPGYFEAHGRVKTCVFRKHRSEGIWVPLAMLAAIGIDVASLKPGDEFNSIDGVEVCRKYVRFAQQPQSSRAAKARAARVRVEDAIVPGQFAFHVDTANLRKNSHKINPEDVISISEKYHGTSVVIGNLLVKSKMTWIEKGLNWLWKKLYPSIDDPTEYGIVWSSRNVIKGVAGIEKQSSNHYYGEDIWGTVAREIGHKIPKGFTIYAEIVGFTPTGSPIQKGYHYGCGPNEHRTLVYRVTSTNEDGEVMELGWEQVRGFCQAAGLEMVPTHYFGTAGQWSLGISFGDKEVHYNDISDMEWHEQFVYLLEKYYIGGMCHLNNKEVPAEGIVVRVEKFDICEAYKLKSFEFLKRESDLLDTATPDMEADQAAVEDTVE